MEKSRLVKMVVEKQREVGGLGWLEEYEVLRSKFVIDNEGGQIEE